MSSINENPHRQNSISAAPHGQMWRVFWLVAEKVLAVAEWQVEIVADVNKNSWSQKPTRAKVGILEALNRL
jgi:hypothetical protein